MVFRRHERGGGPAEGDEARRDGEEILRALEAIPIRREDVSAQTLTALEQAESAADSLLQVADEIDETLGLSEAQELARLSESFESLSEGLEAFEQVPGLESHVERMQGQLHEARELLETDRRRAEEIFRMVRESVRRLPEVTRTIRELSISGAPRELIDLTASSVQFFGTDQEERATLIMRAANIFVQNQDLLLRPTGTPMLEQLQEAVATLSDTETEINFERSRRYFDNFQDNIEESRQARLEGAESAFSHTREYLGEMLEETRRGPMRAQIERTMRDLDAIVLRLSEEASEVSEAEISRMARRSLDLTAMIEDLRTIRSSDVRSQVAGVYSAALDTLANGGSRETYELILRASDEMVQSQGGGSQAYRRELAARTRAIHRLYPEGAEETDEMRRSRDEANSALIAVIARRYSSRLEEAAGRAEGDAAAHLREIGGSLDEPSSVTLAQLGRARAALDISESMSRGLRGADEETRAGAAAICSRGFSALESGGSSEVAIAQRDLAERYVAANAQQREELERLSGRLGESDEVLDNAVSYLQLDRQISRFTSDETSRLLRPGAGREQMAALVEELETLRGRLSSGSIIPEERVSSTLAAVQRQMEQDEERRAAIQERVDRLRERNPELSQEEALRTLVLHDLTVEENRRLGEMVSLGETMLTNLQRTRQPEFRAEMAEIYGFSIAAFTEGNMGQARLLQDAAGIYYELAHSSVTVARERAVVLDAARAYSEGRMDRGTAESIFQVQRQRATYESQTTDAATLRNVRAYFDFALLAARGRDRGRASAILDAAVAYGRWANTDETSLTDEQRTTRRQAMDFIEGQLGDYSRTALPEGRRIADIGTDWQPGEGEFDAPMAAALVAEETGGNFVESLGAGEADDAISSLEAFSERSSRFIRAHEQVAFEQRCQALEGEDARYEQEASRLMARARRLRASGNEELADHFEFQASIVTQELATEAARVARLEFSRGTAAREEAHALSEELSRAEQADEETMRRRIGELTEGLPEIARTRLDEDLGEADTDGVREIYEQILRAQARGRSAAAQAHFQRAEQIVSGSETFDSSVHLRTRRRHRGRREIHTAVRTAIGLAEGYEVDLLGRRIERDGEPVAVAAGRRRTLDARVVSQLAVGRMAVGAQQAVQATIDRGLRTARRELRVANVANLQRFIRGMIDTLPTGTDEERGVASRLRARLESAGDDVAALTTLMEDAGGMFDSGGRVCVYRSRTDGTGGLVYDGNVHEESYQRVRRLWLSEDFREARREGRTARAVMRAGAEVMDARIGRSTLRRELSTALVSPGHGTYLDDAGRRGTPTLRTRVDVEQMRDEIGAMLDFIVGNPPTAEVDGEELRRRLEALPQTIEPGSEEAEALQRLWRDVRGVRVGPEGRRRTISSIIREGGTPFYNLGALEAQAFGAMQLAESGDLGGAEAAIAAATEARQRATAVQRTDIRRLSFRRMAWERRRTGLEIDGDFTERAPPRRREGGRLSEAEKTNARLQREDRNAVLRDPDANVVEELEASYMRGAADLLAASDLHRTARDHILRGGTILRPSVLGVTEYLARMSREQREMEVPGTHGMTYAELATRMDELSVEDPVEASRLAFQLNAAIFGNPEILSTVVGSIVESGPEGSPFSDTEIAILQAELGGVEALGRDRQRGVAWTFARMMLRDAQEDLRVADQTEINIMSLETGTGGRMTFEAHRASAARGIELARASLQDGVDVRFHDILLSDEELTVDRFVHRGARRAWHSSHDGQLFVSTHRYTLVAPTVRFNPREALIRLNEGRYLEYTPYADATWGDTDPLFRRMAAIETRIDLAQLGVALMPTPDGSTYARAYVPTAEDAVLLRRASTHLARMRGNMQAMLLEHSAPIGPQGAYLERIGFRYEMAEEAVAALLRAGSSERSRTAARRRFDQRMRSSHEYRRGRDGRYEDSDQATIDLRGSLHTWQSGWNVAESTFYMAVGTVGIATGNPIGLAFASAAAGQGLWQSAAQYHMTGEMTGEIALGGGLAIVGMVIPFAGLALQPAEWIATAGRGFTSAVAPGVRRGLLDRIRTGVLTPHWGDMSRGQRALHLAGLGMFPGGTAQALISLPQLTRDIARRRREGMSWFGAFLEYANLGIQTALPAAQMGFVAMRYSGSRGGLPRYSSRGDQIFRAIIFGDPFVDSFTHGQLRQQMHDEAMASSYFARLPGARATEPGAEVSALSPAQESYLRYIHDTGDRIQIDAGDEARILRDYSGAADAHARDSPDAPPLLFDQFLLGTEQGREIHMGLVETQFAAYRAGSIPRDVLPDFERHYADAREGRVQVGDGVYRSSDAGPMSEADAYQYALRRMRGEEPTPTPPTAPPVPPTPAPGGLGVAPGPGTTAGPAPHQAMRIRGRALRARVDAVEEGVLVAPGDGVPAFRLREGDETVEVSSTHVRLASEIIAHCETLLGIPEAHRQDALQNVPENIRAQVGELISNEGFVAATRREGGADRRVQMLDALERVGRIADASSEITEAARAIARLREGAEPAEEVTPAPRTPAEEMVDQAVEEAAGRLTAEDETTREVPNATEEARRLDQEARRREEVHDETTEELSADEYIQQLYQRADETEDSELAGRLRDAAMLLEGPLTEAGFRMNEDGEGFVHPDVEGRTFTRDELDILNVISDAISTDSISELPRTETAYFNQLPEHLQSGRYADGREIPADQLAVEIARHLPSEEPRPSLEVVPEISGEGVVEEPAPRAVRSALTDAEVDSSFLAEVDFAIGRPTPSGEMRELLGNLRERIGIVEGQLQEVLEQVRTLPDSEAETRGVELATETTEINRRLTALQDSAEQLETAIRTREVDEENGLMQRADELIQASEEEGAESNPGTRMAMEDQMGRLSYRVAELRRQFRAAPAEQRPEIAQRISRLVDSYKRLQTASANAERHSHRTDMHSEGEYFTEENVEIGFDRFTVDESGDLRIQHSEMPGREFSLDDAATIETLFSSLRNGLSAEQASPNIAHLYDAIPPALRDRIAAEGRRRQPRQEVLSRLVAEMVGALDSAGHRFGVEAGSPMEVALPPTIDRAASAHGFTTEDGGISFTLQRDGSPDVVLGRSQAQHALDIAQALRATNPEWQAALTELLTTGEISRGTPLGITVDMAATVEIATVIRRVMDESQGRITNVEDALNHLRAMGQEEIMQLIAPVVEQGIVVGRARPASDLRATPAPLRGELMHRTRELLESTNPELAQEARARVREDLEAEFRGRADEIIAERVRAAMQELLAATGPDGTPVIDGDYIRGHRARLQVTGDSEQMQRWNSEAEAQARREFGINEFDTVEEGLDSLVDSPGRAEAREVALTDAARTRAAADMLDEGARPADLGLGIADLYDAMELRRSRREFRRREQAALRGMSRRRGLRGESGEFAQEAQIIAAAEAIAADDAQGASLVGADEHTERLARRLLGESGFREADDATKIEMARELLDSTTAVPEDLSQSDLLAIDLNVRLIREEYESGRQQGEVPSDQELQQMAWQRIRRLRADRRARGDALAAELELSPRDSQIIAAAEAMARDGRTAEELELDSSIAARATLLSHNAEFRSAAESGNVWEMRSILRGVRRPSAEQVEARPLVPADATPEERAQAAAEHLMGAVVGSRAEELVFQRIREMARGRAGEDPSPIEVEEVTRTIRRELGDSGLLELREEAEAQARQEYQRALAEAEPSDETADIRRHEQDAIGQLGLNEVIVPVRETAEEAALRRLAAAQGEETAEPRARILLEPTIDYLRAHPDAEARRVERPETPAPVEEPLTLTDRIDQAIGDWMIGASEYFEALGRRIRRRREIVGAGAARIRDVYRRRYQTEGEGRPLTDLEQVEDSIYGQYADALYERLGGREPVDADFRGAQRRRMQDVRRQLHEEVERRLAGRERVSDEDIRDTWVEVAVDYIEVNPDQLMSFRISELGLGSEIESRVVSNPRIIQLENDVIRILRARPEQLADATIEEVATVEEPIGQETIEQALERLGSRHSELLAQAAELAGDASNSLIRQAGDIQEAIDFLERYPDLGFTADQEGRLVHPAAEDRIYSIGDAEAIANTVDAIKEGSASDEVLGALQRAGVEPTAEDSAIARAIAGDETLWIRDAVPPAQHIMSPDAAALADSAIAQAALAVEPAIEVGGGRTGGATPAPGRARRGTGRAMERAQSPGEYQPSEAARALLSEVARIRSEGGEIRLTELAEEFFGSGAGSRISGGAEFITILSDSSSITRDPREGPPYTPEEQIIIAEGRARGETDLEAVRSLATRLAHDGEGLLRLIEIMGTLTPEGREMLLDHLPGSDYTLGRLLEDLPGPLDASDPFVAGRIRELQESNPDIRSVEDMTKEQVIDLRRDRAAETWDMSGREDAIDAVVSRWDGVQAERRRILVEERARVEQSAELLGRDKTAIESSGAARADEPAGFARRRGLDSDELTEAYSRAEPDPRQIESLIERLDNPITEDAERALILEELRGLLTNPRLEVLERSRIDTNLGDRRASLQSEIGGLREALQRIQEAYGSDRLPAEIRGIIEEIMREHNIRNPGDAESPEPVGVYELFSHVRQELQGMEAEKAAALRDVDIRIGEVFDLLFRADIEGRIQGLEGFEDATITGIDRIGGLGGVYRIQLDDGRAIFARTEDGDAARLGESVIEARGMITGRIYPTDAYGTGLVANGSEITRPLTFSEDVHQLLGQEIDHPVVLPDGREVTRAVVRGVAMARGEIFNIPTEPAHPGDGASPERMRQYRRDLEAYQRRLDAWMGRFESSTDPTIRHFYERMQTAEGRREILQALHAYMELSASALLPDRFARNTMVVLLEVDGQPVITFQPIDLDIVGGRIERHSDGRTNFSGFDSDFIDAVDGFLGLMARAASTARRLPRRTGAEGREATPETEPAPAMVFTPDATSAFDIASLRTEAVQALGGVLAEESGDARARAIGRVETAIRAHADQHGTTDPETSERTFFVGAGYDTTSPTLGDVGYVVSYAGQRLPIERRDGRVRIGLDQLLHILDENSGRRDEFRGRVRRRLSPEPASGREESVTPVVEDTGEDATPLVAQGPTPEQEQQAREQVAARRLADLAEGLFTHSLRLVRGTSDEGFRDSVAGLFVREGGEITQIGEDAGGEPLFELRGREPLTETETDAYIEGMEIIADVIAARRDGLEERRRAAEATEEGFSEAADMDETLRQAREVAGEVAERLQSGRSLEDLRARVPRVERQRTPGRRVVPSPRRQVGPEIDSELYQRPTREEQISADDEALADTEELGVVTTPEEEAETAEARKAGRSYEERASRDLASEEAQQEAQNLHEIFNRSLAGEEFTPEISESRGRRETRATRFISLADFLTASAIREARAAREAGRDTTPILLDYADRIARAREGQDTTSLLEIELTTYAERVRTAESDGASREDALGAVPEPYRDAVSMIVDGEETSREQTTRLLFRGIDGEMADPIQEFMSDEIPAAREQEVNDIYEREYERMSQELEEVLDYGDIEFSAEERPRIEENARRLLRARYGQEDAAPLLLRLRRIDELTAGGMSEIDAIIQVAREINRGPPRGPGGAPRPAPGIGGGEIRPGTTPITRRPGRRGPRAQGVDLARDRNLSDPQALAEFARQVVVGEGDARSTYEALPADDPVRRAIHELIGTEEDPARFRRYASSATDPEHLPAAYTGHLRMSGRRAISRAAEQIGQQLGAEPAPTPTVEGTDATVIPIGRARRQEPRARETRMPQEIQAAQELGILNPDATEAQVSLAQYAREVARGDASVDSLPPAVREAVNFLVQNEQFAAYAQSHDASDIEAVIRQSRRRVGSGASPIEDARLRPIVRDLVSYAHESIPQLPELQPRAAEVPLAASDRGGAVAGEVIPGQFEGPRAFGHSPEFYAMMGERTAIAPQIVGGRISEYRSAAGGRVARQQRRASGARPRNAREADFDRMDALIPQELMEQLSQTTVGSEEEARILSRIRAVAEQAISERAPEYSEMNQTAQDLYDAANHLLVSMNPEMPEAARVHSRQEAERIMARMDEGSRDALDYLIAEGSEFRMSTDDESRLLIADMLSHSIALQAGRPGPADSDVAARLRAPAVTADATETSPSISYTIADMAHMMVFGTEETSAWARQMLSANSIFLDPDTARAFGGIYRDMVAARAAGEELPAEHFLEGYLGARPEIEARPLGTDDALTALRQDPTELVGELLGQPDAGTDALRRRLESASPEELRAWAEQREDMAESVRNPRAGQMDYTTEERTRLVARHTAEAEFLRGLAQERTDAREPILEPLRGNIDDTFVSFVDEFIGQGRQITPESVEHILAIFGNRDGERGTIVGDFADVMLHESMGGNADEGHAAINGFYGPQTGRILAFGNSQHIPIDITGRCQEFTIRVDMREGTISDVYTRGDAEIPSLRALEGLRVSTREEGELISTYGDITADLDRAEVRINRGNTEEAIAVLEEARTAAIGALREAHGRVARADPQGRAAAQALQRSSAHLLQSVDEALSAVRRGAEPAEVRRIIRGARGRMREVGEALLGRARPETAEEQVDTGRLLDSARSRIRQAATLESEAVPGEVNPQSRRIIELVRMAEEDIYNALLQNAQYLSRLPRSRGELSERISRVRQEIQRLERATRQIGIPDITFQHLYALAENRARLRVLEGRLPREADAPTPAPEVRPEGSVQELRGQALELVHQLHEGQVAENEHGQLSPQIHQLEVAVARVDEEFQAQIPADADRQTLLDMADARRQAAEYLDRIAASGDESSLPRPLIETAEQLGVRYQQRVRGRPDELTPQNRTRLREMAARMRGQESVLREMAESAPVRAEEAIEPATPEQPRQRRGILGRIFGRREEGGARIANVNDEIASLLSVRAQDLQELGVRVLVGRDGSPYMEYPHFLRGGASTADTVHLMPGRVFFMDIGGARVRITSHETGQALLARLRDLQRYRFERAEGQAFPVAQWEQTVGQIESGMDLEMAITNIPAASIQGEMHRARLREGARVLDALARSDLPRAEIPQEYWPAVRRLRREFRRMPADSLGIAEQEQRRASRIAELVLGMPHLRSDDGRGGYR